MELHGQSENVQAIRISVAWPSNVVWPRKQKKRPAHFSHSSSSSSRRSFARFAGHLTPTSAISFADTCLPSLDPPSSFESSSTLTTSDWTCPSCSAALARASVVHFSGNKLVWPESTGCSADSACSQVTWIHRLPPPPPSPALSKLASSDCQF